MIAGRLGRTRATARCLLAAGIVLRLVTWVLLRPVNRDFHIGVILRMLSAGRLLLSNETDQSYHPPLYYLLATPVFALTHRPKIVQLLSLAFGLATLLALYRLIIDTPLFGRARDRLVLFGLVAVHPQLMTYGLYISNDPLTILLGTATLWQFWRWLDLPSRSRLRTLAVLCGLGLLTKATFLAIVPVLAIVVALLARRFDRSTALRHWLEFVAISTVLGSYKFVENYWHFGSPFVTNLDAGYAWIAEQASGRTLPWAYVGFDVRRLLWHPMGVERRPYLEALYQTFWYEYLPMSNLAEARRWPYHLTGSAVLVVASVPTLIMLAGVVAGLASLPRQLAASGPPSRPERIQLARGISIAVLVAILLLMVGQEMRTHVWSIMHSRLLLPGLVGGLAALQVGWTALRRVSPAFVDRVLLVSIMLTSALLLVQHVTDLALVPLAVAH